jgi:hypothetical protein
LRGLRMPAAVMLPLSSGASGTPLMNPARGGYWK